MSFLQHDGWVGIVEDLGVQELAMQNEREFEKERKNKISMHWAKAQLVVSHIFMFT